MFDTIVNYVFMFFVFSAIGWAIECTYRSLGERRIINSGFLYGPMCPIYGTGCLVFDIVLVPLSVPIEKRLILVLVLGMILADTVEYVTSFLMEKLFNARWWDYSNNFLNLHGRICFKHTCYWAIFAFAYVYLIAPVYRFAMTFITQQMRFWAVIVILVIFAVDLFFTVKAAADINKLMRKLNGFKMSVMDKAEVVRSAAENKYEELLANKEKFFEWRTDMNKQYLDIRTQYENLREKGSKNANRLLSIYSTIKKTADEAISEIEDIAAELKSAFTDSDNEMM